MKMQESYHLQQGMELNGKYIIDSVIGFGGFGTIYKAWDQNLEKVIAVKEYYPTVFLNRIPGEKNVEVYDKKKTADFEKGKREFLEEARTLAKFNSHPNIVHVYDFFEENGTAYFTMEFLSGVNLKTYLQMNKQNGKKISVDTAVQITKCILNALKSIHSAKIIHRDIKPANVFICDDDTIKLIDLGAARFSDQETEKTRTIIITPGYAPAEQYQIKSKQGPATDIYAVAAVLYEMLTGVKPAESINRKVEDTVVEPKKINSEVSDVINAAVMRAMAIQTEIRFQNVEQFSKALSSSKMVRDAGREISYRKNTRNFRIALLAVIVVIAGCICVQQFQKVKKEAVLEPAELEIWVPYGTRENKAGEEELIQKMSQEFLTNNEVIQISVTAIPENEYENTLKQALSNNTAPDVFDSSCLSREEFESLADLNKIFESDLLDTAQYYLLSQYSEYFPEAKQLPLTVNIPVIYENTVLDSSKETENLESFINKENKKYIGTLEDYVEIQHNLSGVYDLSFGNETAEKTAIFGNLWSINGESKETEYLAAIRLLYYFLSETSQDYFTIQNNNQLPLNKNVLDVYMDVNSDFSGVDGYLNEAVVISE